MKATFDGQDYMVWLDRTSQELQKLRKEKLEAPLVSFGSEEGLGKIVSIELAENDAMDGIELKYLPKEAKNFDEIERIAIKMSERAYNHVMQRGQFGTRYNGSDKIDILEMNLS